MRLFIILFLFTLAPARAENPVVLDHSFEEVSLGQLNVNVIDIGEPVFNPYELRLNVTCTGGGTPTPVIRPTAICQWIGAQWDSKNSVLTLRYKTAAMIVGDAPCRNLAAKKFRLAEFCAKR